MGTQSQSHLVVIAFAPARMYIRAHLKLTALTFSQRFDHVLDT